MNFVTCQILVMSFLSFSIWSLFNFCCLLSSGPWDGLRSNLLLLYADFSRVVWPVNYYIQKRHFSSFPMCWLFFVITYIIKLNMKCLRCLYQKLCDLENLKNACNISQYQYIDNLSNDFSFLWMHLCQTRG